MFKFNDVYGFKSRYCRLQSAAFAERRSFENSIIINTKFTDKYFNRSRLEMIIFYKCIF